ncbi:acyltransferase [Brachybacterium sp. YJGR34]|uniref:acyltransferase family protein n=1 Tax=Brachybacterium sp. YJGR34 TaxID=2059911 RepID=UPI000E0B622E|nr:acyltransferase [Brachybacterium sp. YJGR34]
MRAADRIDWMDELRGLAVVLVLLHHALTIPGVLGGTVPSWQPVMEALAPYRMPVMLALSGLLLPRSLAKPLPIYGAGKVSRILWPFLLWTVITNLVLLTPGTLTDPWAWIGGSWHLWFLAVLLACYLVAPLTRWVPAWLWPLPMVLLAPIPGTNAYEQILWYGAFFLAGAALARRLELWQQVRAPVPIALTVVAAAAGVCAAAGREIGAGMLLGFAVSVAGILAAVWIAPRVPRSRTLRAVGRQSLVVYLVHFPAIGAAYLLIGDISWWVLAPVLVAVGGGASWAATRISGSLLFRLPARSERARAAVRIEQVVPGR